MLVLKRQVLKKAGRVISDQITVLSPRSGFVQLTDRRLSVFDGIVCREGDYMKVQPINGSAPYRLNLTGLPKNKPMQVKRYGDRPGFLAEIDDLGPARKAAGEKKPEFQIRSLRKEKLSYMMPLIMAGA